MIRLCWGCAEESWSCSACCIAPGGPPLGKAQGRAPAYAWLPDSDLACNAAWHPPTPPLIPANSTPLHPQVAHPQPAAPMRPTAPSHTHTQTHTHTDTHTYTHTPLTHARSCPVPTHLFRMRPPKWPMCACPPQPAAPTCCHLIHEVCVLRRGRLTKRQQHVRQGALRTCGLQHGQATAAVAV